MPCPLCGDICRCSPDAHSAASPRWLPEADAPATTPHSEPIPAIADTLAAHRDLDSLTTSDRDSAEHTPDEHTPAEPAPEDSVAWRREVASRLNRYQARRKPRPPRYPSLRLRFEQEDSTRSANSAVEGGPFPTRMAASSNQALALDQFAETGADVAAALEPEAFCNPQASPKPFSAEVQPPIAAPAPPSGKLIEFPRSWTPPAPPLDELAEPVVTRPRILEAPEIVPPAPALGGITIEAAQQPEIERRPGIDLPLQGAPLPRRILAAAIDGLIIATACTVFAAIFWRLTAIRPPRLQIIGLASGLFTLFWAAFQYLLVVYSGATPGLRLARLELSRFDGTPAPRRLRRWRVLASFLSAVSLGMGYAWVFLDEDALCWHDRITHTYLAPKKP
jgi:uncharacterized RDD family membrane protein YckC